MISPSLDVFIPPIPLLLFDNEIMDEEQFTLAMSTDATLEDLEAIRDRKLERSKLENEEAEELHKKQEEEAAENSDDSTEDVETETDADTEE